MFTLIVVFFSLLFMSLFGWTITTYLVKKDSRKSIKEEFGNLLDINKMLFVSMKSLVEILASYTFSSDSHEISEICINPSMPPSNSTNTPKSVIDFILPIIF